MTSAMMYKVLGYRLVLVFSVLISLVFIRIPHGGKDERLVGNSNNIDDRLTNKPDVEYRQPVEVPNIEEEVEEPWNTRIRNVIVSSNRDQLFYDVDLKISERNALIGGPTKYLPGYRNPCWYARIGRQDGGTNFTMDPSMNAKLEARLAENENWRMRCLPLVYQLGFAKSGTTDLFKAFGNSHPNILFGRFKEPLYWSWGRVGRRHQVDTFERYLDTFDVAAEQIRRNYVIQNGRPWHPDLLVDGSTNYAYFNDGWRDHPGNQGLAEPKFVFAHTLRSLVPQAKLIFIIRQPTERSYSRWRMLRPAAPASEFDEFARGFISEMAECLRHQSLRGCAYNYTYFRDRTNNRDASIFLRASLYYVYLRDWFAVFPPDQILVLRAEDYFANRTTTVRRVHEFLGLDTSLTKDRSLSTLSASPPRNTADQKGRSPEKILPNSARILDDFFAPYNRMLADLLQDERFLWAE